MVAKQTLLQRVDLWWSTTYELLALEKTIGEELARPDRATLELSHIDFLRQKCSRLVTRADGRIG